MELREQGDRTKETKATIWHKRMGTGEIVIANAIPVIGVWFFGWDALGTIFFYWLDGLFALWGLGVVASVITIPEVVSGSRVKLLLVGIVATCLTLAILSIPSVLTAGLVITSFEVDVGEFLHQVFRGYAIWFALLIAILSYAGQTISELRLNPSLTIRQSGKERGNLFFHRSLLMGILARGSSWGQPPRWVLAAYVLAVACLFTYSQLYPERYLRVIGFAATAPGGKGSVKEKRRKTAYFVRTNDLSVGMPSALFFVLGLFLLLFALSATVTSIRSSSWPTVPGTIFMSDPARPWDYIKYAYQFPNRDQLFIGTNIRTGLVLGSLHFDLVGDRERVRLMTKYARGTPVTVFHNPENPRMAVLEPGFNRPLAIPLILGYLFTMPGFFIIGRALNALVCKWQRSTFLSLVLGGIASLAAIVLVINLLIPHLPVVSKYIRSPHWGTVPGEVIIAEKRVDRGFDNQAEPRPYPNIVYSYEVNLAGHMESFTSETIRAWSGREQDDWENRDDNPLNTYKQGMAVTVYYNPVDPGEAVLEPGNPRVSYYFLFGVGILFVVVWLGFRQVLKKTGIAVDSARKL